MNERDLDTLVDVITARVREQLDGTPKPQNPYADPSKPCAATKGQCVGCGWAVRRREKDTRKIIDLGAARIATAVGVSEHGGVANDLARFIDHTMLKLDTTRDDLRKLCEEARTYRFATVCVNATNVRFVAPLLRGSPVRVCAVVGFPLGASTGTSKAFETREAVRSGADEIDTVINVGALKSRDYATVLDDICEVVKAAGDHAVKVILETASLTHDEKVIACALSKVAGAAFVKTSTGFGAGGATAEDVALMKMVVGDELQVKASGGVRTADDVRKMISAGATRIGASASVAIVTGKTSGKSAKKAGARKSLY
ncbi:MAG: deoxyribose-phosphate aldolase [Myxococcota bacterium]|jgi:deoxyribose-phosphate aldolase